MITYFSDKELGNIKIQKISPSPLPAAYLTEREKVWQVKMEEAVKTGAQLWNGEVYTLDKLIQWTDDQILLNLGTCEYKDILYRIYQRSQSTEYLLNHPVLQYLTVCCIPVTTDDRFVFGIRSGQTAVMQGSLSLIGGTLNKDKKKFTNFRTFSLSWNMRSKKKPPFNGIRSG